MVLPFCVDELELKKPPGMSSAALRIPTQPNPAFLAKMGGSPAKSNTPGLLEQERINWNGLRMSEDNFVQEQNSLLHDLLEKLKIAYFFSDKVSNTQRDDIFLRFDIHLCDIRIRAF